MSLRLLAGAFAALAGCGASQAESDEPLVNYQCVDEARASNRAVLPFPRNASDVAPVLPTLEVPPALLERARVSGNRKILPDDRTKDPMRNMGIDETTATFKLCLDVAGVPFFVDRVYSSCFSRYDEDIRAAMMDWRYSPHLQNGQAVPVCTTVTFVYAAHNRRH